MSFLWGGREKFEKDDNTIRGVYKLNPSFGFIDKKKYFGIAELEYTYISFNFEDSIKSFGGGLLSNILTKSSYQRNFFTGENFTETTVSLGGGLVSFDLTRDSFDEYVFIKYPFTGYKVESVKSYGGIAFVLESE